MITRSHIGIAVALFFISPAAGMKMVHAVLDAYLSLEDKILGPDSNSETKEAESGKPRWVLQDEKLLEKNNARYKNECETQRIDDIMQTIDDLRGQSSTIETSALILALYKELITISENSGYKEFAQTELDLTKRNLKAELSRHTQVEQAKEEKDRARLSYLYQLLIQCAESSGEENNYQIFLLFNLQQVSAQTNEKLARLKALSKVTPACSALSYAIRQVERDPSITEFARLDKVANLLETRYAASHGTSIAKEYKFDDGRATDLREKSIPLAPTENTRKAIRALIDLKNKKE